MNRALHGLLLATVLVTPSVARAQSSAIAPVETLEPVPIGATPSGPPMPSASPDAARSDTRSNANGAGDPEPPPIVVPARRAEIHFAADYVRHIGSAYNDALALWGFAGFYNSAQFSVSGLAAVTPAFLLGARVGWLHSGAGIARADGQSLDANVADAGVVARLRHEWGGTRAVGRVAFDLDVGPAFGTILLRDVASPFASLRLAGTLSFGFAVGARLPFLSLRIGGSYLPHGGAGVGFGDPVFGGVYAGLAIEAPL